MPFMVAVLTLFAALMVADADAETDAELLAEMFSPMSDQDIVSTPKTAKKRCRRR